MSRNNCEIIQPEKTIFELKLSIDSIEKMIEKSKDILNSTRPLNIREVRSDSIELRFASKSKSKSKENKTKMPSDGLPANAKHQNHGKISKIIRQPQKTKPMRQNLRLDIESINSSHEPTIKANILIHDSAEFFASKPVGQFEQSFARSIQNRCQTAKNRVKTLAINKSLESTLNDSLESKTEFQQESGQRRTLIKKKENRHMKKLFELENCSKKKTRIFDPKTMKGRYSYYRPQLTEKQIKKYCESQLSQKSMDKHFRMATMSSARESCNRHEKQSDQNRLQSFLKKVKQYGFVERYLSEKQICHIYEYLKSSTIPEYKWPLFVVDEVYEKMQTPKTKSN